MTLEDGSPLVRRELIVALQWIVSTFLPTFINLCKELIDEDEEKVRHTGSGIGGGGGGGRPVSPKPGHISRTTSEDKMRRKSEMAQRKSSKLIHNDGASNSIANRYDDISGFWNIKIVFT